MAVAGIWPKSGSSAQLGRHRRCRTRRGRSSCRRCRQRSAATRRRASCRGRRPRRSDARRSTQRDRTGSCRAVSRAGRTADHTLAARCHYCNLHNNTASRRRSVNGVQATTTSCAKFQLEGLVGNCLQCFDAVGWAAGRASGL